MRKIIVIFFIVIVSLCSMVNYSIFLLYIRYIYIKYIFYIYDVYMFYIYRIYIMYIFYIYSIYMVHILFYCKLRVPPISVHSYTFPSIPPYFLIIFFRCTLLFSLFLAFISCFLLSFYNSSFFSLDFNNCFSFSL